MFDIYSHFDLNFDAPRKQPTGPVKKIPNVFPNVRTFSNNYFAIFWNVLADSSVFSILAIGISNCHRTKLIIRFSASVPHL